MKVPPFIVRHRIQLVDLLRELNILGPAAEIGVAEGNFSRDLLAAGIPFLYLVDAWQHIPNVKGDGNSPQEWHDANFSKTLKKLEAFPHQCYQVVRTLSIEAAQLIDDDSLSLVYLDGDHSYNGVMSDLRAWYPKVIKGGVIAGHDFLSKSYGVQKAVCDFVNEKQLGLKGEKVIHLIPEEKTEDAGFYFIKQ